MPITQSRTYVQRMQQAGQKVNFIEVNDDHHLTHSTHTIADTIIKQWFSNHPEQDKTHIVETVTKSVAEGERT